MRSIKISTVATFIGTAVASLMMITETHAAADIAYFRLTRSQIVGPSGSIQGYAVNVGHAQNQSASSLTAIRPNGQQTWEYFNPFIGLIQTSGSSLLSAAEAESWSNDNFNGTWQYGQGGTTDRTFDMAPVYSSWTSNTGLAQQRFVSLTASSIAQFEAIRAQGLTGTFTFNFDSPVSQYNTAVNVNGHPQANLSIQYTAFISNGMTQPYEIVDIDGSSFSVNITSALESTANLRVTQAIRYEWVSTTYNRSATFRNDTYYGIAPVPAPGAIALFSLTGLAGLAGRRRR